MSEVTVETPYLMTTNNNRLELSKASDAGPKPSAPVFRSRFKRPQPNLKVPANRVTKPITNVQKQKLESSTLKPESTVPQKPISLAALVSSDLKDSSQIESLNEKLAVTSDKCLNISSISTAEKELELPRSITIYKDNKNKEDERNSKKSSQNVTELEKAPKNKLFVNTSNDKASDSEKGKSSSLLFDQEQRTTAVLDNINAQTQKDYECSHNITLEKESENASPSDASSVKPEKSVKFSDVNSVQPPARTRFRKVQPNIKSLGSRFAKPSPSLYQKETESFAIPQEPVVADKQNSTVPNTDSSIALVAPAALVPSTPRNDFPYLTSLLKSPKKRFENKEIANKRKRYAKGENPPERSKMTMMDLIYWNPAGSPMKCSSKSPKVEVLAHERVDVDEPAPVPQEVDTEVGNMPGPRLVIGENGEIIIDEESLVIRRTVPEVDPSTASAVFEDNNTTYSSFRKQLSKRGWSNKETAKFYKALSVVGTDFSLMENLLPNRSRRELKLKFKREEKQNSKLIDKVLYDPQKFDISVFEEDEEIDEIIEESPKKNQRKKRNSKKASQDNENKAPHETPVPKKRGRKKNEATSGKKETNKVRTEKNSNKSTALEVRESLQENDSTTTTNEKRGSAKAKQKRKRVSDLSESSEEDENSRDIEYAISQNGDNSEQELSGVEDSSDSVLPRPDTSNSDAGDSMTQEQRQFLLFIPNPEFTPTRSQQISGENAKTPPYFSMPSPHTRRIYLDGSTAANEDKTQQESDQDNVQVMFLLEQGPGRVVVPKVESCVEGDESSVNEHHSKTPATLVLGKMTQDDDETSLAEHPTQNLTISDVRMLCQKDSSSNFVLSNNYQNDTVVHVSEEDFKHVIYNEEEDMAMDTDHGITDVISIRNFSKGGNSPNAFETGNTTETTEGNSEGCDDLPIAFRIGSEVSDVPLHEDQLITDISSVQDVTTTSEEWAEPEAISRVRGSKSSAPTTEITGRGRRRKRTAFVPRLDEKSSVTTTQTINVRRGRSQGANCIQFTPVAEDPQIKIRSKAARCSNFTPADQFPNYNEKNLEFTPARGRTYVRQKVDTGTQGTPNLILSSLQTPSFTPNRVDGPLQTTLNSSQNSTITIPMTPSPCTSVAKIGTSEQSPGPVMLFAQSPSKHNVVHVFMFNNSSAAQNDVKPEFSVDNQVSLAMTPRTDCAMSSEGQQQ